MPMTIDEDDDNDDGEDHDDVQNVNEHVYCGVIL